MGGFLPPIAPGAVAAAPIYAAQFAFFGGAVHLFSVSDPKIIVADFLHNAVGNWTYRPNVAFAPNGILWAVVYPANNGTPMVIDTGGGAFGTGKGQAAFNILVFNMASALTDVGTQQIIFQLS